MLTLNTAPAPATQPLEAEIVRLNKIITALMNRAEREANSRMTSYGLFQTTVTLENQVRSRTMELSAALDENEKINRKLQLEIEERKRTNQELEQEHEEQRKLIHKLEEAHSQLLQSEKLASIGQLAAGVAHEINNPIGFVYSNLGTLQRYVTDLLKLVEQLDHLDTETPEEHSERVKQLKQQIDFDFLRSDIVALINESLDGATRVRRIVQDLRDFSRPSDAEWQLADLHRGLDSTINVAWNEIKYKAEIVREYGNIPEVECLPFQLNQVFLNLLVNAAHAIDKQGKIIIRTNGDNEFVTISIRDTGSGIAPDVIHRIFDPFFTTKPIGKGTGLGLSVAYGIIAKHNGEITVSSQLNEGTEFVIRLPIQQQKSSIMA